MFAIILSALLAIGGATALANSSDAAADVPVAAAAFQVEPECAFEATLIVGEQSRAASADAVDEADELLTYDGTDIAVIRESGDVTASAVIYEDVYLALRADADREAELVAVLQDTIDDDETHFEDEEDVDLALEYSGDHCDLTEAANSDDAFKEFFRGDANISFGYEDDDGDGECRIESRFSERTSGSGKWEDFDLSEFSLDFDFDDDNDRFAIRLDTGEGTISLNCNGDS